MKPASGVSTSRVARTRSSPSPMSECGRQFEEVFKEHHSPTRQDERRVKNNRRNYGTEW